MEQSKIKHSNHLTHTHKKYEYQRNDIVQLAINNITGHQNARESAARYSKHPNGVSLKSHF